MRINIHVAGDDDRYDIAAIRNSGREFMTHDTSYITNEQQDKWWFSANRQLAYIWVIKDENDSIGFCMIREMYDSGRRYGTLALLPEYRGLGIGTAIYKFMVTQVDELWIDIRNDNIPSMNAAIKAGFIVHHIGNTVTELIYRKEYE